MVGGGNAQLWVFVYCKEEVEEKERKNKRKKRKTD